MLVRNTLVLPVVFLALLNGWPDSLKAQDSYGEPNVINGVAVPGDFPRFIPSLSGETAPGYIFINNWEGSPYIMAFENDGTPFFYRRVNERARDFKVHSNGYLSRRARPEGGFIIMDRHFREIDTVKCQNGYGTDEHGLQLVDDGYAMMIALEYKQMDLSQQYPGGNPDARVIGNHVQIIDSLDNVVFEWRCWDYFDLEDSYTFDPSDNSIDYIHMNSTAIDYDGHIVMSSRHLSECTKIHRETGEIIWRLGGKNNQFDFINDEDQISFQHDFRPVEGKPGHYTLFDNGNMKDPRYSRAVEFYLDTAAMTAEKVWEYRHSPDRYSSWMGNAQRLPNGNTLINWADHPLPKATEVTPEGEVVYEADFGHWTPVYRTFRFEFDGYMLEPYLVAEPYPNVVRLIFNQFGDRSVDFYNIYGGTEENQLEWMDSTRQTWLNLTGLEDDTYYYFEVTAVDTTGVESDPSNREYVYSRRTDPADNLILNGDFSQGSQFWIHLNDGGASSYGTILDNTYKFRIQDGGTAPHHVQLYQPDIPLEQGKSYVLELDARAESPRTVEIKMGKNGTPWTNYSKTGFSYFTEHYKHFEFPFVMEDPTDLLARLVINGGGSDVDFDIRSITLKVPTETGISEPLPETGELVCYPNPSAGSVSIQFKLTRSSAVLLELYSLSGKKLRTVLEGAFIEGTRTAVVDTSELPAGTYLIRLKTDFGVRFLRFVNL